MNDNKIFILDIETTGFLQQGGSIVEIGIVDLDLKTGEITEVYESPLNETIFNIDHTKEPFGWIFKNSDLTVDDVITAPFSYQVFEKVQKILDSYPLGGTAFNNAFDFGFLRDRGLSIKALACPMKLSTNICKLPNHYGYPGYKWPKVEEAFSFFFPDIDYTEKHRGLDDAKHEAMIVYKLYQMGVFTLEEQR